MEHGTDFLKIKLKHLAAESRIIRDRERKASGELRNQLHNHRVGKVRIASRHTHLAYAFLRGKAYREVERTCRSWPNWKEVDKMTRKYGGKPLVSDWYDSPSCAILS